MVTALNLISALIQVFFANALRDLKFGCLSLLCEGLKKSISRYCGISSLRLFLCISKTYLYANIVATAWMFPERFNYFNKFSLYILQTKVKKYFFPGPGCSNQG